MSVLAFETKALLYIHSEEAPVRRLGYRFEEFGRLTRSACASATIFRSAMLRSPFDPTYMIAMQVHQFSLFLLREAPLKAQLAQVFSERSSGVRDRHAGIIELMTTMSLHTMSVM